MDVEALSELFTQLAERVQSSEIAIIVLSNNSMESKVGKTEGTTPIEKVTDIPLFKYIHPSVTDDNQRVKIHREVVNLVHTLPLAEICKYLRLMYKDKRVYLNVKTEAMFDELHRLGMPDENTQGFSHKNFQNYFNTND